MFFTILYLIFTAILLTFLFSSLFRNRGPWGSFGAFLAIIFLVMFAFTLWVPPLGPVWNDVAWVDALFVGLIIALLLSAAGEPRRRDASPAKEKEVDLVAEAKADKGAVVVFGIFFWSFMIIMSAFVVFGIIRFFQAI